MVRYVVTKSFFSIFLSPFFLFAVPLFDKEETVCGTSTYYGSRTRENVLRQYFLKICTSKYFERARVLNSFDSI